MKKPCPSRLDPRGEKSFLLIHQRLTTTRRLAVFAIDVVLLANES
jgi:hypothetical protein